MDERALTGNCIHEWTRRLLQWQSAKMDSASDVVSFKMVGDVGVVTLDDGKVNALSYSLISQARKMFAAATDQAAAVVIAGRLGCLSAGFDLKEVVKGPEERDAIISVGELMFGEIFATPKPVVIAGTGHAVAGGTVFLLAGDARIGCTGPYKTGFNEVSIGVPMPSLGIALTQYRLSPAYSEAALLGDLYGSEQALAIGFYDKLVAPEDVMEAAMDRARELSARSAAAYGATKLAARAAIIARLDISK